MYFCGKKTYSSSSIPPLKTNLKTRSLALNYKVENASSHQPSLESCDLNQRPSNWVQQTQFKINCLAISFLVSGLKATRLGSWPRSPRFDSSCLQSFQSELVLFFCLSCVAWCNITSKKLGDKEYYISFLFQNRNFGFEWGSSSVFNTVGGTHLPCLETYSGPRPWSELETRAIRDFVLAHKQDIEVLT